MDDNIINNIIGIVIIMINTHTIRYPVNHKQFDRHQYEHEIMYNRKNIAVIVILMYILYLHLKEVVPHTSKVNASLEI
jgi:uncharacterized membrane protein YidH (DUF202 family)